MATLSKGKCLKVHDLNSIVTIGSVRYHVDKNQIVGTIVIDTTDMYARPIGDTPSRWLSPDPLSEEFTSWSPYTFVFNSPMRFIDPDGMAPDDFVKRKDGSIYWDNNANSQATTKSGETYLGKTLTFNFNSYINGKAWDGPSPPFVDPAGDKLTSSVTLKASENENGELTGLSASKSVVGFPFLVQVKSIQNISF